MKPIQSFLMMYYILEQCYDYYEENDLGGFLGAISPGIFADGLPVDKAIFEDWIEITNLELLNNKNIIKKIYDFLEYYEKKYEFNFSKTTEFLIKYGNKKMVDLAIIKTEEMYKKFNYDN